MIKQNKSFWFTIVIIFVNASVVIAGPLEDCKEYVEMGVPGVEGEILCREGYLLAHDPYYKTPIWVAEHLTRDKANAKAERKDKFKADPDLKVGERAELSDYKLVSKIYDRGHMAPSADMRWSSVAMNESCYLSNIVPQEKYMNQQIWKQLEMKVRQWAIDRGELYIYTGPIYDDEEIDVIGDNEVAVPTHIYKVIYDPKGVEGIAFIMPNERLKTSDMPKYIVTIRDVEEKTGLDFLKGLKQPIEDDVETQKPIVLW
jgi:endonuclease G